MRVANWRPTYLLSSQTNVTLFLNNLKLSALILLAVQIYESLSKSMTFYGITLLKGIVVMDDLGHTP